MFMKKLSFFVGLLAVALFFTLSCKKTVQLTIPTSVTTSDTYALKIVITWGAVEDADGYFIYRTDADPSLSVNPANLSYHLIATVSSVSYEDLDVFSGSYYFYRIVAYRGDETTEMSTPIMGETTMLTADEAFTALADYTNGRRYDATSASQVPGIIMEVIMDNAHSGTDLVFLIDDTYSMWDDIAEVKAAVQDIIDILPSSTRLAAAVYNDANEDPTGWYNYTPFTTSYSTVRTFINDIYVYGGGDTPESVYDGIYQTVDYLNWSSSSKRMMLVIGDAPPLEGPLSTHTLNEVINKCKSMGLIVNLYPILIKGYKSANN